MDFLKKHYEKIVLGLVLLVVAGAAAYLPIQVGQIRAQLDDEIRPTRPKEFKPLDLVTNIALLNRVKQPEPVILGASSHNLFNPVGWMEDRDGELRKDPFYGRKGPDSLMIAEAHPLYLLINFRDSKEDGNQMSYTFEITREAAEERADRRKITMPAKVLDKNKIFILKKVQGNPERPEAFVLEFLDTNREITVKAGEEYKEVAGYEVDLSYGPEGRRFAKKRKGDSIPIEKKSYKIVYVSDQEVIVSDSKTTKQYSVRPGGSEANL